jgi:hypothetical protein
MKCMQSLRDIIIPVNKWSLSRQRRWTLIYMQIVYKLTFAKFTFNIWCSGAHSPTQFIFQMKCPGMTPIKTIKTNLRPLQYNRSLFPTAVQSAVRGPLSSVLSPVNFWPLPLSELIVINVSSISEVSASFVVPLFTALTEIYFNVMSKFGRNCLSSGSSNIRNTV